MGSPSSLSLTEELDRSKLTPTHLEMKHLNQESLFPGVELGGKEEKALVRKLDLHIVPLIMALYLFSFLDRVNIGNARLYHMEADLGLVGPQFQTAVSLLFVTYVLCEIPSNMVLKKFTPKRYMASITFLWGVIATLTGLVNNYGQLVACRLLLGVMEAGLFPGLNIYLSFFYTGKELALRTGFLFVSAAISGGFGGLLAYGIGMMDGVAGLHGWRWIFIIEGIPTALLGILTFFVMPNNPDTASFLNDREKCLVQMRRDAQYGQTKSAQEWSKNDAIKAFKDWKVIVMSTGQFAILTMLFGFSTFLPTLIRGLGTWTTAQVQLLTVPCYATGGIFYMVAAWLSDRLQLRAVFIIGAALSSVVGYALLISDISSGAHYFACFMIAAGLYIAAGIPLAWMQSFCPRYGKRATANGIQLMIGNCGGILAPFIYPSDQGPRYIEGHAITMSLCLYAALTYTVLSFWFVKTNKHRTEGKEDYKVAGMTEDQIAELGDESPKFKYTP